jgi:hypothetical protein
MNAARLFGWYTNHYQPLPFRGDTGYWRVNLTAVGDELLELRSGWIALNGVQRWVGGVQLDSRRQSVWRYDPGIGLSREPG